MLLDARRCRLDVEPRGVKRSEITVAPSRLVVMGDAVWYEALEQTGRHADWHGETDAGNLLFLDGSVRFITIKQRGRGQPAIFDPAFSGYNETNRLEYGPSPD